MKKIEIRNITKGNIIVSKGALANSFFTRLKGLLGKKMLDEGEALCIKPCKSIHTFFMRFSIDVVFVDKNGSVCEIVKDLKPNKMSKYISKASYVIELPVGKCEGMGIEIEDKIEIIKRT